MMFRWLFGTTPSGESPTDNQLRYARKIGIKAPEQSDKATLSALIAEAESRDPSLRPAREAITQSQKLRKYGAEKIDQQAQWESLAESGKWLLVVLTRGKSRTAEVVRINGASISSKGIVKIEAEVMKLGNEKSLGLVIGVGRPIEIPLQKIDWYEIVDELDFDDIRRFQKYYQRVKSHA